jgi:hypothetical protein
VPDKIMIVEWADAFIDTGDFDIKEAKNTEPVYRKTVGFLIANNKFGTVLATDLYKKKEDGASAKMFIPKGMIIKKTVLK